MAFNRLNHNILGEIRPRFKLRLEIEPSVALDHLHEKLNVDKTVSGERSKDLVFIKTPSWERHYWSPEMTVRIEVEEYTDFTTASCLIGPSQGAWSLFVFIYTLIGLATLFTAMIGFVKYSQFNSPTLLFISPIGLMLLITAFFTSKIGQKKGRDQSLHLVSFVYHSLNEISDIKRISD